MQPTNISWADWTWGPIRGCSRISPGCQHCYAEADMARKNTNPKVPGCHGYAEFRIVGQRREPHWTGKVELIESKLLEPLSWRKKALKFAEEHGRKPRAFISMSDLFHENLPDEAIDQVFAVAALTPEINYMFLTKRAERMADYFSGEWLAGRLLCQTTAIIEDHVDPLSRRSDDLRARCQTWEEDEPLPNVALGVSVESPKYLDRVAHLLRTPAAMRFVSQEPQLEKITYPRAMLEQLSLVIPGGESGPGARPFDLAWARQTVEQCREAGTACFVKQMGSQPREVHECSECDGDGITSSGDECENCKRMGTFALGINLGDKKGEDMTEWPADLRIREWPEGWN